MTDAPLAKARAKAQLNRCIEDGRIVYSRHFRDELAADDLTLQDVVTACRSGSVVSEPEQDIKSGQWKYRIEGLTADRFRIAVVFTFRTERAIFITVFRRVQ